MKEYNRFRPILNNGVRPGVSLEKARKEVAWYKQCGYGGFAINGTTDKKLDDVMDWIPGYLESCQNYVQAAKEQEMDVWIFDEWGYPSGCACGQVLTDERFRAKKYRICYDIKLNAGQSICLPVTEKFVSAAAFPVDYFSFYAPAGQGVRVLPQDSLIKYTAAQPTRLVAVEWEYLTFITHVMKKEIPGDPTIGTIDIMSKEAVGKFLQSMHQWYVQPLGEEFGKTVKGFFYDEPEICYDFPMTEELSGAFMAQHGYPVEEILPELLAWMGAAGLISPNNAQGRLRRAWDDYTATWTDLLSRNFYGQIQQWCHDHNLLSIGHQDLDNQLPTLCSVSGDFWKNSSYNDRPGIDVIWDNIAPDKFNDFARYAGCAKRTMGKDGAISETFAEMGPSMYPDRMRFTMEQQLLRGVDQFFLYTEYSPEDPNVAAFAKQVGDRVTRTATLLSQGNPGAHVAIYLPMQDIGYLAAHHDPHLFNSNPQPWQRVDNLAQKLCYAPMDYDYAWNGTLDTLLARGIDTLLLAGQETLSSSEEAAARAFCAAGGKVVAIGKPCVALEDIAELAPNADFWLAKQGTAFSSGLTLTPLDGKVGKVSLATRVTAEGTVYFLLNESDAPIVRGLKIEGDWQQLDAETGCWQAAEPSLPLTFEARELKIFRQSIQGSTASPKSPCGKVITLTDWTVTGPDGVARKLDALLPWPQLGFGDYTGFVNYETTFDWQGGELLLTLGEVRFGAVVTLNGETVSLPMAPHTLQRVLPAGRYTLQVKVLNSNANSLYSGEDMGRSHFEGHYWYLYQFERAYCDCGLLGPVQITQLK